MLDLAIVTLDTFTPLLQEPFQIVEGAQSYELRLEAIRAGSQQPGQQRASFTLVFTGQPGLRAQQRIYRLENSRVGRLEIFLTQVAGDARGSTFEAVFN